MQLLQLEVFCRVVDCHGFGAAAADLHLTQPAVSRHVRGLERELGAVLFRREGRGMTLTAAGQVFYDKASQMLRIREMAVGAVREIAERPLVVATIVTCLPSHCGRILRGFTRSTGRDAVLRLDQFEPVMRGVLAGSVDLAVVWSPVRTRRVKLVRLGRERLRLVAPADHALAGLPGVGPEELNAARFVLACPEALLRQYEEDWLRRAGVRPRAVVEAAAVTDMKQAVCDGAGLALLPEHEIEDDVRRGRLVALAAPSLDPGLARDVYAVLAQATPAPATAEFLRYLRREVRLAEPAAGRGGRPGT